MVIYSKAFQKCYDVGNRVEEAEQHDWPKTFEGSFKIMEVDTIMDMVEKSFQNLCLIIDTIVSDYDSTMWYMIKHWSRSSIGQVLKSYKV